MTAELIYQDSHCEVYVGDALDPECVAAVMGERRADLLCVDAPYSEKTHAGHKSGKATADLAAFARNNPDHHDAGFAGRNAAEGASGRRDLDYGSWSDGDVDGFVRLWSPRTAGWLASVTDDVLAPSWCAAYERVGLYAFAPLPLVETGSRVRLTGDGPSAWTCWLAVGRPRSRAFASWGTLPGAYVQTQERDEGRIVGGKPLKSMCAIVSDYSRRGDLVVDPCCGGGTTLLAAKMCGRRAIGIEKDRGRAELSARRLAETDRRISIFDFIEGAAQ